MESHGLATLLLSLTWLEESMAAQWAPFLRPLPASLLVLLAFYVLLFVVSPTLNKRVKLAWAICVPLSVVLFNLESAFQAEKLSLSPVARGIIDAIPWIPNTVPFVFIDKDDTRVPLWLRGRTWVMTVVATAGFVAFCIYHELSVRSWGPNFVFASAYVLLLLLMVVYLFRVPSPEKRRTAVVVSSLYAVIGVTVALGHRYDTALPYVVFGEITVAALIMYRLRRAA